MPQVRHTTKQIIHKHRHLNIVVPDTCCIPFRNHGTAATCFVYYSHGPFYPAFNADRLCWTDPYCGKYGAAQQT